MAKQVKKEQVSSPVEITGAVTVVSTGASKYFKAGKEVKVSAQLAKTLIKKGFAELKK